MKTLVTRDKAVVWHPYTQSGFAIDPLPVVLVKGTIL